MSVSSYWRARATYSKALARAELKREAWEERMEKGEDGGGDRTVLRTFAARVEEEGGGVGRRRGKRGNE